MTLALAHGADSDSDHNVGVRERGGIHLIIAVSTTLASKESRRDVRSCDSVMSSTPLPGFGQSLAAAISPNGIFIITRVTGTFRGFVRSSFPLGLEGLNEFTTVVPPCHTVTSAVAAPPHCVQMQYSSFLELNVPQWWHYPHFPFISQGPESSRGTHCWYSAYALSDVLVVVSSGPRCTMGEPILNTGTCHTATSCSITTHTPGSLCVSVLSFVLARRRRPW